MSGAGKFWRHPVMWNICTLFKTIAFFCVLASPVFTAGGKTVDVSFARGHWNPGDFTIVKSPRFAPVGRMIQHDDHIANYVPAGSGEELMTKFYAETFTAAVYNIPVKGTATLRSKMSFDYTMAPAILIAPELGRSSDDRHAEFREYLEVVLFNEGINIWHHTVRNGKPYWRKLAYLKSVFRKNTVYELSLEIRYTAKGIQLAVRCDGKEFGCAMPVVWDSYYAGIVGFEGVNRFYTFRIEQ